VSQGLVDADMNHITSTIQVFVTSTQSAEIENANFGGEMIYQVQRVLHAVDMVIFN
jgi:hypothetical protein